MGSLGDINVAEPYDSDQESSVAAQIRAFKEDVKIPMQLEHADDGVHAGITLFGMKVQSTSCTISVDDLGKFFICNATSDIDFVLPDAGSCPNGSYYLIKKNAAGGVLSLFIFGGSGNTIDGATEYVITKNKTALLLVSDGADLWTILDISPKNEIYVYKETQEDIDESVVALQDDAELKFAVGAGETWVFELKLSWSTTGTWPNPNGLLTGFSIPASGVLFSWRCFNGGHNAVDFVMEFAAASGALGSSDTFVAYGAVIPPAALTIFGVIRNGATAGNVQFRWCNDADGSGDYVTSVYAGGVLIAKQIL